MTYRKRDIFEIALLKQSVEKGKAILGICRGMQLINVALGGTLYQDLSEDKDIYVKHSQDAPGNFPSHHANVITDSRLYELVGERPYINSRHHQALKDIAPSLRVVAQADDGVAEAVESLENDQILGLQWHPENTYKHYRDSQNIFADLIKRAKKVAQKIIRITKKIARWVDPASYFCEVILFYLVKSSTIRPLILPASISAKISGASSIGRF